MSPSPAHGDPPDRAAFDIAIVSAAADAGRLEGWVHGFLAAGPSANPELSAGLRRAERFWIGPVLLPLDQLQPCCGPGLEFPVPLHEWERRISRMAASLGDPKTVPPLIVEWRSGRLSIRDGNHRHAAMRSRGWSGAWAVVWQNSAEDFAAAREALLQPALPERSGPGQRNE